MVQLTWGIRARKHVCAATGFLVAHQFAFNLLHGNLAIVVDDGARGAESEPVPSWHGSRNCLKALSRPGLQANAGQGIGLHPAHQSHLARAFKLRQPFDLKLQCQNVCRPRLSHQRATSAAARTRVTSAGSTTARDAHDQDDAQSDHGWLEGFDPWK